MSKIYMFLGCLLLVGTGYADEVVIEDDGGECYVLDVNGNDSFTSVVEAVSAAVGVLSAETPFPREFRVRLAEGAVIDISKKVRSELRSYAAGLTPAETADIFYILRTLANCSLPKIKAEESSLKRAGERIDHIHPLHFLGCIFTNEELKVCARNIRERSWVWGGFVNGSIVTLTEEEGKHNVAPFLKDFASRVKIDVNLLIPLQQTSKWEKFVTTLIDYVPRENGGGRYDQ